ncbi:MAG: TonB-dependent receptor, partial [Alphaproteobacteria bacterium]|nr:TonB-dependent receptor [Alphaproteobacteria bacterium]
MRLCFKLLCCTALTAVLSNHAIAQENEEIFVLDEVTVTASRIGVGLSGTSTTIITSEDIKKSPAQTLPELLNNEVGVQKQTMFGGTAAARTNVDLRGFGASTVSNSLVLVNGRRRNDIDISAVDWSYIPIESIERIEIIRGNAGGVLYGDGAIGGVINIITKSSYRTEDYVATDMALGSDNYRETNVSVAKTVDNFSANAYGSYITGNGYRDHNDILQRNIVAEIRHDSDKGEEYINLQTDNQKLELPAHRRETLTTSEMRENRKAARTPFDIAYRKGVSITAGFTRELWDNAELIFDAGVKDKDQKSLFRWTGGGSSIDTDLTTYSITPRMIFDYDVKDKAVNSIVGIDYFYTDYDSYRSRFENEIPYHLYDAWQSSLSAYAQNTIAVTDKADLSAGVRVQKTKFAASDTLDTTAPGGAWESGHETINDSETDYAANFGLDYHINNNWTVFGHLAKGFRLPNIDERIATDGVIANFALKKQKSKEIEAGFNAAFEKVAFQSSAYLMKLDNELHYDPSAGAWGANTNLDKTKRYGIENSLTLNVRDNLTLKGNYSYTKAEFTAGDHKGKNVPLVSNHTAGASLSWDIFEKYLSFNTSVNHVGERRMDNDQENFQPKIPDYTLVDAKFNGEYKALNWSAQVNN